MRKILILAACFISIPALAGLLPPYTFSSSNGTVILDWSYNSSTGQSNLDMASIGGTGGSASNAIIQITSTNASYGYSSHPGGGTNVSMSLTNVPWSIVTGVPSYQPLNANLTGFAAYPTNAFIQTNDNRSIIIGAVGSTFTGNLVGNASSATTASSGWPTTWAYTSIVNPPWAITNNPTIWGGTFIGPSIPSYRVGNWTNYLDGNGNRIESNSLTGASFVKGTNDSLTLGNGTNIPVLYLGIATNNTPTTFGTFPNGSLLSTTNGNYYGVSNNTMFKMF